jgi:hypothetical protein
MSKQSEGMAPLRSRRVHGNPKKIEIHFSVHEAEH